MSILVFAATDHGLVFLARDGDTWQRSGGALTTNAFTCLAGRGYDLLAGARDGIWRSADRGQTWWESSGGLAQRHVRWLAFHPGEADLAFAGTEPAAIFISHDGGREWHPCPEVADMREQYGWYLPYSPAAGAVRGFAFHGPRGYAAVEQGGLLRSDTRGETWSLVEGSTGYPHSTVPASFIHSDVHSVTVHPSSPDVVFAPTGGGLYRSIDGGRSWAQLHPGYCRAVWVDPARWDHMILGAADGVDRNGRIMRSANAGQTWEPAMDGVDEVWPGHMVERFAQVGDELWAVLSNGQLIAAALDDLAWRSILPAIEGARSVVALAGDGG